MSEDDSHAEPATLRVALLGGFRVAAGEVELPAAWRSRKAAQVVKLLAVAPAHALHPEQLTEWLWPAADPAFAANNLRQTLHVARRYLRQLPLDPAQVLRTHGERVLLYPPACVALDVTAFETTATAARRCDDPRVIWEAIERYTGPLLPDDLYEDWAAARREALAQTYRALLDQVAQLHQARGEFPQAISALRRLVVAEPADEAAHLRLMELYAAGGQRPLALRQYQQLVQALARELDLEPEPATQARYQAIKRGETPARPAVTASPPPQLLPAMSMTTLTSFIGREEEIARLREIIPANRLVTLTGAGGSGKTRLALEAARALLPAFRDGVRLVELAPLRDPSLIMQAVAAALQLREEPGRAPREAVVDHLGQRELLLILDNCEHLIEGCADEARWLLDACPALHILATSRARLGLAGELIWRVAPLPVPAPGQSTNLDQLGAVPAVRLFIERARLTRPNLALTAETAPAVAAICRGLDGLPLALELVAARTNVLTLAQIAERLGDSLRLLVAGPRDRDERHRALRATLEWSERLLAPAERALFHRLAVFSGGFTLEAAEAVGAGEPIGSEQVLDLLAGLVDQSLVLVDEHDGASRFRLLEPVRHFAAERLRDRGELDATRCRHAAYYLRLAQEAEAFLFGPEQAAWLARLEREHDNLRVALSWALEHEGDEALRLAAALARFWELRGHLTEGRAWMRRVLANPGGSAALRAKVLTGAGTLAWREGDNRGAATLHQECLELYRQLGETGGMALALVNLGAQALNQKDYDHAEKLVAESLSLARQVQDDNIIVMALTNLGLIALGRGDYARSAAFYEESLPVSRRIPNKHYIAVAVQNLGEIAHHQGDDQRALALHRESLSLAVELNDMVSTAFCLEEIAAIDVTHDDPARAARFLGAAAAIREATNSPPPANYRAQLYDPAVDAARGRLGEVAFAAAWDAGRRLTQEAAVAEALAASNPAPVTTAALSPRERDVALLVARGQTNRQIASTLGIAERTVDNHVSHILRKLGFATRQQIAGRLTADSAASSTA
ncbi:MAG TPA: BTAD domain-containing putative transcriptional regulator [Thermomicrobiaceae bacterium]|nr:BTAD domain-containing putative transcriptional regulator [Thermomicrobiaceae bacterium]